MSNQAPAAYYINQENTLTAEKKALEKQKNLIGWARLVILIAGTWTAIELWPSGIWQSLFSAATAFAIFLWLLARSLRIRDQVSLLDQLISILREEQRIAEHQFSDRFDGSSLAPKQHDYAHDLDIFGRASLYQYINRTSSQQGQATLANWLLSPAQTPEILARQEAAREMASRPDWGIRLQATGQLQPLTITTEKSLQQWLQVADRFYPRPAWKLLKITFPVLSLGCLLLHIAGILTAPVFYLLVLAFLLIAFGITRIVMPQYRALDKVVPELTVLTRQLEWIESASFRCALIQQLQQPLKPATGPSAASAIRELRRILDRFDYRLNPLVFLPLNTFLLWDLQQAWSLEKWKAEHGQSITRWLHSIAELEALNSLGRLHFNHPNWTFPQIVASPGTFSSGGLGHPLIPAARRITNDFSTSGKPAIALITGSNMAGKSTFLRSIGVNQVLAMCGAPACAGNLTTSYMRIMSSMRIADNLEENASTFYAELSKLKSIIEAVNRQEPVLLLLDEILRGTNSNDRHTGSRALVLQLVHHSACGLLATHDLALTSLAEQHPNVISNYHFDVAVSGEELYFDYKLKPGVCESMNASILMKKIGIEL